MRRRALCENLRDMSLGHSKRQKTAKRPHALRWAVCDNARGLSDRVLSELMAPSDEARTIDVVLGENPYELRSRAIRSAKNSVIYKLLSNLKFSLTVKFKSRIPKKFLP